MIQRVQTVYLLLSMFGCMLLYYLPVWQTNDAESGTMTSVGAGTHFTLLPLPFIIAIMHAFSIFSFKTRKRQLAFCMANIVLLALFLIWALINIQIEHQFFQHFDISEFRLGSAIPLIGIALNILARRMIRKDEELVRSTNRLR